MHFMRHTALPVRGLTPFLLSLQETRNHLGWEYLLHTEITRVNHPDCTEVQPFDYHLLPPTRHLVRRHSLSLQPLLPRSTRSSSTSTCALFYHCLCSHLRLFHGVVSPTTTTAATFSLSHVLFRCGLDALSLLLCDLSSGIDTFLPLPVFFARLRHRRINRGSSSHVARRSERRTSGIHGAPRAVREQQRRGRLRHPHQPIRAARQRRIRNLLQVRASTTKQSTKEKA